MTLLSLATLVSDGIECVSSVGRIGNALAERGVKVTVVLTFILSIRAIPELLRDDVLAPKISRKLILTGRPFAFWTFGIVID